MHVHECISTCVCSQADTHACVDTRMRKLETDIRNHH